MNGNIRKNNGPNPLRDRIAQTVFNMADSLGISNREMKEQLTDQVIHLVEQMHPRLPGMDIDIPDEKVRPADIHSMMKQILSERGEMETTTRTTNSHPVEQENEDRKIITNKKAEINILPKKKMKAPKTEAGKFSPNAMRVLEKRYLKKDDDNKPETPEKMFRRVASNIALAEAKPPNHGSKDDVSNWEEQFYRIMSNLEFLPNSPTLMNAGRDLQQLSACFVLPIEDSMESIFDTIKHTALIHKSGGGTGFSFSRLRPAGDTVGSTGGVASGPVSFMRAFDAATDVIKQGGTRRGANMAILRVDHPDIEEFITAKEKGNTLTNFNLSVAVPEKFMHAVLNDKEYDLINPRTKLPCGKKSAKKIFDMIVDMAWRTGDPGLVFIDRMNGLKNPTPNLGDIESTNPCGEQPLLPYESCNLGSINLSKMIKEVKGGKPEIDDFKLAETVRIAVRFLDDVIDMNKFPMPEIEKKTKMTRKIGLGVMGFADMLYKLEIPYNSDEALYKARHIMKLIQETAWGVSVKLAEEREPFPAFKGSRYDVSEAPKVRNATRTTIAPTGTLSIIANCSSGIEPLFALSYVRHILDGAELIEVNPYFEEVARKEGFYSEELMKKLAERGSLSDMEEIPDKVKKVFVTAHDISPEWHIKMQAAFQKNTCNAVSKTINFPHNATREDVARAFMLAYETGPDDGCRGITIYRDKSKDAQVLNVPSGKGEKAGALTPRKRTKITKGETERVTTGCGSLYVTVNSDEHGICEVFSSLGKTGGCAAAQLEAISRLISLALRSGVDVAAIVKHIRGIRCPSIAWEQGHAVLSCPDAIASVLERHIKGNRQTDAASLKHSGEAVQLGGQCPECGGMLVYQEGCRICHGCGYTKCS